MNDNDAENPLPFESLATITARLLQSAKKEIEKRGEEPEPGYQDRQQPEADRAYVEQRLRDFEAFERRARGQKKPR